MPWITSGSPIRFWEDTPVEKVLDEIKVAGALSVREALTIMECELWCSAKWVKALQRLLMPPTGELWCGIQTHSQQSHAWKVQTTAKYFRSSIDKLMLWKVLEKRDGDSYPIFARYFEVLKANGLMRAILDCRSTNKLASKPPPVVFATIPELVAMVEYFPSPEFLVLDLRHFFFQIPLPKEVRHLFSIKVCGDEIVLQSKVWPMGFSWSPFGAQSISSLILMEAARRAGHIVDIEPDSRFPPSVLIFRNSNNRITALGVLWYDNILVAAGNTVVRNAIAFQIKEVTNQLNIIVKDSRQDESSSKPSRTDGISKSSGQVSFLGLHFVRTAAGVLMKHMEDNIRRWSPFKNQDWCSSTPRQVATGVGIVTWDWMARGQPKGVIARIIGIARKLGKHCTSDRSLWDLPFIISEEENRALREAINIVLQNPSFPGVPPRVVEPDAPTFFLASDAMDSTGAGMEMAEDHATILVQRRWTEDELENHINWKETVAAAETIEKLLATSDIHDMVVCIGVDNSCAVFALQHFIFSGCEELSMRLLGLFHECEARDITLDPVHVPGQLQPADGSRSRAISMEKVRQCLSFIKNRRSERWELSRKHIKGLLRRKREVVVELEPVLE